MNYYYPEIDPSPVWLSQPNPPPQNRFIYINKQNFFPPTTAQKVLVNPHFKNNKTVYVNPKFSAPKIHVNPNILRSFAPPETKPPAVISTRNKLVRVPEPTNRKRRHSIHSKYKIVRSNGNNAKSPLNRFKLDKRNSKILTNNRSSTGSVRSIKKKYVYVNRFLSISVMAKNVLLKQNSNLKKPGFVNINGILYKKSPNSLRKAADSTPAKSGRISLQKIENKPLNSSRKSVVKRYKIVRSRKVVKVSPNKLRKCNIPCGVYRKFGRCKGKETGTCFKLHNPNQIVLCSRFLQGACLDKQCLLSHKVSLEKMPACKYYLDGLCSRDDCPYLHVKVSAKAEICRDFLEGYCKEGAQCNKRHQYLCPDFEKHQKCVRRKCPYPHVEKLVRECNKIKKSVAKKCLMTKQPTNLLMEDYLKSRYYKEKQNQSEDDVIETGFNTRPKLGELPAFIPFTSENVT